MDCELNQLNHLKDPTQTNDSGISDSLIFSKHITLLFASHTLYGFRKLVWALLVAFVHLLMLDSFIVIAWEEHDIVTGVT